MKIGFTLKPKDGNILDFEKQLDNLEKIKDWEAAEKRMEIIGQNGNNGEHYENEEIDPNLRLFKKDGREVSLKEYLQKFKKGPSDDETKTY